MIRLELFWSYFCDRLEEARKDSREYEYDYRAFEQRLKGLGGAMEIKELRFVMERDSTHCYVKAETLNWRHKAFPSGRRIAQIILETFQDDSYMAWEELGPPQTD